MTMARAWSAFAVSALLGAASLGCTVEPSDITRAGGCKICRKGCACGDSCISCEKTCRKGPGCACDAVIPEGTEAELVIGGLGNEAVRCETEPSNPF